MKKTTFKQRLSHGCYRIIRGLVWLCYPKTKVMGLEQLPDGPCILVSNHAQMNGPIVSELYIPGKRAIWCAGEMMHLKEVPAYAYQDFWSGKPGWCRWFYRLLSYVIAPLSACVFTNANTIAVYHDSRITMTFRESVKALENGAKVVVFPEGPTPHNNVVNRFRDGFVDVARLYHKRTGQAVQFVPMYVAPKRKAVYLGVPIQFDPAAPRTQERGRICGVLMQRITELATALPLHTVVPYSNIPKWQYPHNICSEEQTEYETTGC